MTANRNTNSITTNGHSMTTVVQPFSLEPSELPPSYQNVRETFALHRNATYHISQQIGIDRTAPHIIFPPFFTNRLCSVPKTHAPYFADQEPIGFADEVWNRIWNQNHEVELDEYLQYGRGLHNNELIPWTYEHEFNGATYRLSIDFQHWNSELPLFTHGTIISFGVCNGYDYRYIIDHCLHIDDNFAYLKVICFNTYQSYFDTCST